MSNFQKNLLIFFGSILIAFILTLPIFKVIAVQPLNLISPTIGTQNTKTSAVFSTLIAPSLSLKADIATVSGLILWQPRDATEETEIALPQKIQQGESLKTGDNGNISLEFPNTLSINISPKSEINIAQTLPVNLVFVQKNGTSEYLKKIATPISVRALHLLINQNAGDLLVATDSNTHIITVGIKKGDATIAFNDSQNMTQIFDLKTNQEYVFDDDSRTGKLKSLK